MGRWAWLTALFLSGAACAQAPAAPERIGTCTACHGADGNSQLPGVPSLAGQPKVYLENYLVLTRDGLRSSAAMQQQLRGLSDREIVAIANHFSALPARPAPVAMDAALAARGRKLAAQLRCGVCHLKDFSGQKQMPRLAGQREEYLVQSMLAFRDAPPPGSDTQMSAVLYGVPDADLKALAHYLAAAR